MTSAGRKALASATLASLLFFGSPARACWDGFAAEVGKVSLAQGGDDVWHAETARALAQWLPRIDGVLPEGSRLEVQHGLVLFYADTAASPTAEARWNGKDPARLFETVLRIAPGARARQSRAHGVSPFTVQVLAATDRARAIAFAAALDRRNEDEPLVPSSGFYSAGGFPALHPVAHVLGPSPRSDADGNDGRAAAPALTRVVVGAYLDADSAKATAASLVAHGVAAFVRPL